MKPLLHLGSNVVTDRPLLHLGPVITFVPSTIPLTRNPDPLSEFGLKGNQTFSLLGGIFRGVIFSHLYQSVNKAKVK